MKHGNDRINFLRYICYKYFFNKVTQTNYSNCYYVHATYTLKHYMCVHNCAYNTFLRYIEFRKFSFLLPHRTHVVILGKRAFAFTHS